MTFCWVLDKTVSRIMYNIVIEYVLNQYAPDMMDNIVNMYLTIMHQIEYVLNHYAPDHGDDELVCPEAKRQEICTEDENRAVEDFVFFRDFVPEVKIINIEVEYINDTINPTEAE